MTKELQLTASQEDYLEAIYNICDEKKAARAKDIAEYLQVRASSVTGALRTLAGMNLVNYAPYDLITLTSVGKKLAADVVRRHNALKGFLISVLGVEEEEAEVAACKMEHTVSKQIVERFIKYADYIEQCPKGGITWKSGFGYYCKEGCGEAGCRAHDLQPE